MNHSPDNSPTSAPKRRWVKVHFTGGQLLSAGLVVLLLNALMFAGILFHPSDAFTAAVFSTGWLFAPVVGYVAFREADGNALELAIAFFRCHFRPCAGRLAGRSMAGYFFGPIRVMSSLLIILLVAIAGAAGIPFLAVVLVTLVRSRRVAEAPSPPEPPFNCPACGSAQMEVLSSGLWDGVDGVGRGTGGSREIGTCKVCGVHAQHMSIWDQDKKASDYATRKLTDEEWNRETEPHEKWKRQTESWPFTTGVQ